MRWFQVVIALAGGVLCEGLRVLLYIVQAMPYNARRFYTLPTPLSPDLWVFAPLFVIPVLMVILRLLGADWRRSIGAAFLTYIGGASTYQFTQSLKSLFAIGGTGSVFQNYEVQVLTLIMGAGILCLGLVVRNPTYPRWTVPVLLVACLFGWIGAANREGLLGFVGYDTIQWFYHYQAAYIITCTVYGLILVLAWRKPVDDLGTGTYRLGKGGDVPAIAPDHQ